MVSSDATLNEEYVLSRIEDLRQLRGEPAEKTSRIQGKGKKGPMCFACKGYGHLAKAGANKQDQEEDAGSAADVTGLVPF